MKIWVFLTVLAITIIGFVFLRPTSKPTFDDDTANSSDNHIWTQEESDDWMANCYDVTLSEFEDGRGNPISDVSARAYCSCYLKELVSRKISPAEESDFIDSVEWGQVSERCYRDSLTATSTAPDSPKSE